MSMLSLLLTGDVVMNEPVRLVSIDRATRQLVTLDGQSKVVLLKESVRSNHSVLKS